MERTIYSKQFYKYKYNQVGEKERESRKMASKAFRVEHHAEELKRYRAKSLEEIASKRTIYN